MHRRHFLAGLAAAGLPALAGAAAPAPAPVAGPKLGVDLFSLRSQGWNAFQLLDYCAKFGVRTVHFSEIQFLGSLDDGHVREVGQHAASLGIEVEIGMRSICPSSSAFDPKAGTAEEQLTRMLHAATVAGSKLVRGFLGTFNDRKKAAPGSTKEPIESHIDNAIASLRAVRSRVLDAGLKIAIENHAGDMQARELKSLIEGAGPDFVGACFDSGNPCWVLEDPHLTLETLAPYILTSHIRDSYLWNTDEGTAVNWVRLGQGNVGIDSLLKRYMERCPGKAMSLEVIVMGPRMYPWRKPEFWDGYRTVRAWEFSRFLALAAAGKPQPPSPQVPKDKAAEQERADFEASMRWISSSSDPGPDRCVFTHVSAPEWLHNALSRAHTPSFEVRGSHPSNARELLTSAQFRRGRCR
jgi:sugar phosphate isomerase/epimerase